MVKLFDIGYTDSAGVHYTLVNISGGDVKDFIYERMFPNTLDDKKFVKDIFIDRSKRRRLGWVPMFKAHRHEEGNGYRITWKPRLSRREDQGIEIYNVFNAEEFYAIFNEHFPGAVGGKRRARCTRRTRRSRSKSSKHRLSSRK
jgi:hypothetical protein